MKSTYKFGFATSIGWWNHHDDVTPTIQPSLRRDIREYLKVFFVTHAHTSYFSTFVKIYMLFCILM